MSPENQQPDYLAEAHELIVAICLLEDRIDPAQAKRLEELVREHQDVRQLYVTYVHQQCVIAAMAWPADVEPDLDVEQPAGKRTMDDALVTSAIKLDPKAVEEEEELLPSPPRIVRMPEENPQMSEATLWRIRKYLLAGCVLLAVGIFWAVRTHQGEPSIPISSPHSRLADGLPATQPAPKPEYAAVLTHEIGAHWIGAEPAVGDGFDVDAHLALSQGFAELTLSSGVSVILEAPAQITIQPNAVDLPAGKLAASVPASGRGFAVYTPQSTLIDLGTQLGVEVRPSGTEVDVFKGTVTAQAAQDPVAPVTLHAGKAASVTDQKVSIDPRGAVAQRFVLQLQSDSTSLDVVDLVAGGVGTTHRRGAGIDLQTGVYGTLPAAGTVMGDGQYHQVDLPVVDGACIPQRLTKIDSAGDQYDFGITSGRTYGGIHAGLPIAWLPGSSSDVFTAVLAGVDYAGPGHGFLLVHATSAVTLNLSAVRRLCLDKTLASFHALVGNTAIHQRDKKPLEPHTDALVLVDGKVRFSRPNFTRLDGAIAVDVPLTDSDHFLTLATVDHQNNTEFDWNIFADPVFQLAGQK